MADLHAIGTVVTLDDRRYVVVGHRMTHDGELVAAGYALVPYPLGFVGPESLSVVPVARVGEVAAEGLSNEVGEAYLTQLDELVRASEGIAYGEYAESVRLLQDFIREGDSHV